MQRPNDFMQERSKDERKSRSGRQKLFGHRLSNDRRYRAFTSCAARESMQIAEQLQSEQTHVVTHGFGALPRSFSDFLFCGH